MHPSSLDKLWADPSIQSSQRDTEANITIQSLENKYHILGLKDNIDTKNKKGQTTLMLAIEKGNTKEVEYLITVLKANTDEKDNQGKGMLAYLTNYQVANQQKNNTEVTRVVLKIGRLLKKKET